MKFLLVLLALFIALIECKDVTFYLNECISNLVLGNYHVYWGSVVTPPPSNITDYGMALMEFEYQKVEAFGSLLDWNLNYWQQGNAHGSYLLHGYFNVNDTDGLYIQIEDSHTLGWSICTDVKINDGTLPSVVGVYVYWLSNQTADSCKSMTKTIPNCEYMVQ